MRIKIFLICILLITCSCFRLEKKSINENTIISSVSFDNMSYLPKTVKLYLYKVDTSFRDLVLERDSIKPYYREKEVEIILGGNFNFSLAYDFRFIIDDTICFDLSDFETIPDTMGRTMRGWAVRAKLLSFKCNDSILVNSKYDSFELPFESRRIIKKGQYDKL